MGSSPVAFPVLLWLCLKHLVPLCFCACSGQPDFPFPVCVSRIPRWMKCSLLTATYGSSSAAQYCVEVFISSIMRSVGWFPHWCRCVAEGELGYVGSPPHSPLLPLSLCHPSVAAPRQGQECLALSWHWVPCVTATFLPFSFSASRSLHSPCPDVSWDLPISV